MRPRRFVLNLDVPRALMDDQEAFDAFTHAYWLEMLDRADGVPAEDPMIRAIVSNADFATNDTGLVPIHVIGYALPRIQVDTGIDVSAFPTSINELIQGLVGAEMNLRVGLPNDFEGGVSGTSFPVGSFHVGDADSEGWDRIPIGGPNIWYAPDDEIPNVTDHQRARWHRETNTSPQGEHWGDSMSWSYEEGKKIL